jgi:hypothetical protein
VISLTSQGKSRSNSTVPLLSTMQSAQDRNDTDLPPETSLTLM